MSEPKVVPELLSVDQVIEQSAEDYKKALALASTTRLQEFNRSVINNQILIDKDDAAKDDVKETAKTLSQLLQQKAAVIQANQNASSNGFGFAIFISGVVFATVTITMVIIKISKKNA
jgi:hypothetical protein